MTGSRAANWSRAPAASPAAPVQRGEVTASGQGIGVLGAEDPLDDGQQGGKLVPAPTASPPPGPVGEFVAGGQRMGVLGTQDPLDDGQQGGELVTGTGRVPRAPVQRARLRRVVKAWGDRGPGSAR